MTSGLFLDLLNGSAQRLRASGPAIATHHGRANGAAGAGGDDGLRGAKVAAEHHPNGSSDDLRWLEDGWNTRGKWMKLEDG